MLPVSYIIRLTLFFRSYSIEGTREECIWTLLLHYKEYECLKVVLLNGDRNELFEVNFEKINWSDKHEDMQRMFCIRRSSDEIFLCRDTCENNGSDRV